MVKFFNLHQMAGLEFISLHQMTNLEFINLLQMTSLEFINSLQMTSLELTNLHPESIEVTTGVDCCKFFYLLEIKPPGLIRFHQPTNSFEVLSRDFVAHFTCKNLQILANDQTFNSVVLSNFF